MMLIKCRYCNREFDKPSHRNQHERDVHKNRKPNMNNDQLKKVAIEALETCAIGSGGANGFTKTYWFDEQKVKAAIAALTAAQSASLAKVEQEQKPRGWFVIEYADNGEECLTHTHKGDRGAFPLYAAPQAQQEAGKDDVTADECIELAEALCWESMRQAIAGTRNAASLLEDASFRIGMETACDEIETRLNLASSAQTATVQELDNILQELVDIAQENDMGYGAPAAQADTQQSKKG